MPNNHRVLRGGSFNNNARNARCAYRNSNNPDNRNRNNGFRVVVVSTHFYRLPKGRRGLTPSPLRPIKKYGGAYSWLFLYVPSHPGRGLG